MTAPTLEETVAKFHLVMDEQEYPGESRDVFLTRAMALAMGLSEEDWDALVEEIDDENLG